ncbi:hypothetical protein CHU32_03675 [Superficieibacter electus]|uniref:Uncharacterized protein n=1 Tax=Superficieibacter electus TaxID=2022662 RepID=A0A2P5GVF8_9ENTR|nr:hypothetical protein [Superficieibacter electus]POP42346.1 hypothetical protein CHU33_19960 [Superficieibacter electus]POP50534.1 hypothetical protein CHU32_03675 [Superficieibacter electus]
MNVMKKKDFNSLPEEEKQAFLKGGGKVKDPIMGKIFCFVAFLTIFGGIARCSTEESKKEEPRPWDAAESACLSIARQKDTSLLDLSVASSKSLKKGGYKITVRVEQEKSSADLGVICYTKEDGTITKSEVVLLKKK